MALKKEHPEQLAAAKTFLMVPDYLNYLALRRAANEYHERQHHGAGGRGQQDWDDALIEKLGLRAASSSPSRPPGPCWGI